MRFGHSLASEDVANLADTAHAEAGFANGAQDRAWRLHGKIMTPRRAAELAGRAIKRPGDNAPDAICITLLPGDLANLIKPLYGYDVFMRGNLQDGIGRSIEYWMTRKEVFGAQLFQDRRAALRIVADEFHVGLALDRAQ